MRKLLELKALDTEVRELLRTVEIPAGIYICPHMHYLPPTISIYRENLGAESIPTTNLMQSGVVLIVDTTIDEQTVDEIITQIEKVLA